MTLPFEPRSDDPAANHLNTLLDAMRSGTRAPDAASPETLEVTVFANAAGQLRGLVRRADAPATAFLDDHPLHDRWEDIMTTAFPAAQPHAPTGGTFPHSAPVSNRSRRLSEPPISNRLNTWLSAAIVALMLVGTVGGAWWFGPGQGGSGNDGVRLAAVTQDDATPVGTPHPATNELAPLTPEEAPWIAPISPDECIAEPMSQEEYAEAITTDPGGIPDESSEVVGPAEPEAAVEALITARGLEACMKEGQLPQARAYQTTENLFFNSGSTADNAPYVDQLVQARLATGERVSAYLGTADPSDFTLVVTGIQPSSSAYEQIWEDARAALDGPNPEFDPFLLYFEHRYNPENALEMSDGRILLPATRLLWEDDPMVQAYGVPQQEIFTSNAIILENVDGQWLVDETNVWICVGECDAYWAQMSGQVATTPGASPVATPQAVSSAPAALMDMLSAVPAETPDSDNGRLLASTYVDVERQLASMGITSEEAADDPLRVIGTSDFGPIAWVSNIFHYGTDEEFVTAIGFNPLTVQQALSTGALPDHLTVLRGDWDANSLIAAWIAAGYTEYTTESGAKVWTLGPEGEIDPAHPIQSRMALQLNNVAILDDRILMYAGTMDALELALDAHSGDVESARDDPDMAHLLATVPANTVSLFAYDHPGTRIYDMELIAQNPNIRPGDLETLLAPLEESRGAVGAMPNYHGMIIGITSGALGDASTNATPASVEASSQEVFVRIGADSEEDATQIATVIEWRWTNFLSQRYQQPLESVMSLTEAKINGSTVVLTFDPMGNPPIWMELFLGGDLMLFAVDSGDRAAPGTPMATPEG